MRKTIIAGNWKMHKTISEAIELTNGLKRNLIDIANVDIVLCPPFTALAELNDTLYSSNIKLGAQNVYWEEKGAFTGEISPGMLKDVGCEYVIIGHSERRQFFAETNSTVNKKVKAALKIGLMPIICIGETLQEREQGITFDVVKDHLVNGLVDITTSDMLRIIIAYEPVWAIGTGKTATSQQAQEAHSFIRKLIAQLYDDDIASQIRIQYGGSIKPSNIAELVSQPDIDGGLVGGASLEIDAFTQIVKLSAQIVK